MKNSTAKLCKIFSKTSPFRVRKALSHVKSLRLQTKMPFPRWNSKRWILTLPQPETSSKLDPRTRALNLDLIEVPLENW